MAVVVAAAVLGLAASATPSTAARYSSTGAFAWGGTKPAETVDVFSWHGIVRDEATGLPKVLYDGVPYWNTVTVSLYGLQEFNRYAGYNRRAGLRAARRVGNWLVRNQPADGAWRYEMVFNYPRLGTIAPPWVAAQAQGNAISLLVRLYAATGKQAYLRAARKARTAFQRPIERAGVRRRYASRVFFEGFPTAAGPALPLEDFQLAILGLYDLSRYDKRARRLWRTGMRSLVWALPLYEAPGTSHATDALRLGAPVAASLAAPVAGNGLPQFDLAHRTVGVSPSYSPESHAFNARLLRLLARQAKSDTGLEYASRWLATVAG